MGGLSASQFEPLHKLLECPQDLAPGSSRVIETQESKVCGKALYDLVSEVLHSPFHPILSVRSESLFCSPHFRGGNLSFTMRREE